MKIYRHSHCFQINDNESLPNRVGIARPGAAQITVTQKLQRHMIDSGGTVAAAIKMPVVLPALHGIYCKKAKRLKNPVIKC